MALVTAERKVKGLSVLPLDPAACETMNRELERIAAVYAPAYKNDKQGNMYLDRSRSAFRETAKAYGFGDGEISRIERRLFHFADPSGVSDSPWDEIVDLAKKIEGRPRGLSMHCGGLMIAPERMDRYAPVETSLEGYPLLSWEKEGTETTGFVKIDLLGNRSLAVIRDALANLEEQGIHIDRDAWRPVEDTATVEALSRSDSMGVFYIEFPAMRQPQKKPGRGILITSSFIRALSAPPQTNSSTSMCDTKLHN
jgi:DNA polymerase-3 subunit alpha/error-prone DNA polymerase